jgi:hypothetical protein
MEKHDEIYDCIVGYGLPATSGLRPGSDHTCSSTVTGAGCYATSGSNSPGADNTSSCDCCTTTSPGNPTVAEAGGTGNAARHA